MLTTLADQVEKEPRMSANGSSPAKLWSKKIYLVTLLLQFKDWSVQRPRWLWNCQIMKSNFAVYLCLTYRSYCVMPIMLYACCDKQATVVSRLLTTLATIDVPWRKGVWDRPRGNYPYFGDTWTSLYNSQRNSVKNKPNPFSVSAL